jgi:hypothetical protein
MSTLVYQMKWRPLRVGWCVKNGDIDAVIRAFRLTHCLWGGRFNPIIVMDDEAARLKIDLFHIDILWPVGEEKSVKTFAESIKHLPSPFIHDTLFPDKGNRKECALLDVTHPIRIFFEEHIKDKETLKLRPRLYQWAEDDPLANSFEATFGAYPPAAETGIDYEEFVIQYAAGEELKIGPTDSLDRSVVRAVSANALTSMQLRPEVRAQRFESGYGLFVGTANSFSHLIEFWNLRAAGLDLLFFDLRFPARFDALITQLERLVSSDTRSQPILGEQRLTLWLACKIDDNDLKRFTVPLSIREVNAYTWDERIWKGFKVTAPVMHFPEYSSVAQISDGEPHPMVTLELRHKPGFNEASFNHQHLVVTLKPTLNFSEQDRFLFTVPFIPEMNEYFGRNHYFDWNTARAEREGLGIITRLGREHVTLFGLERFAFARQLFKTFGIRAEVSQPGLICDQLIRQMGGIQGCEAFKIKGVRQLIQQFEPWQSFSKSDAMTLIGDIDPATGRPNIDQVTGKPKFAAYEHLYIEARDKEHLNSADVFSFLLKRRVFHAGLKLNCPTCGLPFWRALDDLQTLLTCEYCGKQFNVTPHLKDRNWAYRPSGLFGRGDNQEGGVPVALTLQQLETTLSVGYFIVWLPAMTLEPITAQIEKCETDFVLLCQDWHGRLKLVVGECKANGEIAADDVRKLSRVADAFPSDRFDVFLVFSKTSNFKQEEIDCCRAANLKDKHRTILLSERELEPYRVYERAVKEFSINDVAVSLEDLVEATRGIYFEPQFKR